jgi:hypothetical protein
MRSEAKRLAAFPGERLEFRVWPDPRCPANSVEWSGGETPPSGTGTSFRTSFEGSGEHLVSARCGEASAQFRVTICPIAEWMERAREFFGPALDFTDIKVKTSPLVLGKPGTGFTCNQVVRFKRPHRAEDLPHESTLIHELGHVWEHQGGQAQLLRGFLEQIGKRFGRDPYDYGGPNGVRDATSLTSFRTESQAQIIQEFWKAEHGVSTDSTGIAFSTPGYVDGLRKLARGAGIGTAPPLGRTLASSLDGVAARVVNAAADLVDLLAT